MKLYRSFIPLSIGLLALVGCGQVSDTAVSSPPSSPTYADGQKAMVKSVDSANTVTVDIDGSQKQVRLLNVVAPTENNNVVSGSCLIEESTHYLSQQLPVGTSVTLQFDDSLVGASGYLDAALYSGENFINADLVRAGMATTTFTSQNDEFYSEISRAQQQAAEAGVGLYSKEVDCTIPHQIEAATVQAQKASDISAENERIAAYKEASGVYNSLSNEADYPAKWVGSIVTLKAVSQQLDDLKEALGTNYYDEKGMTPEDLASASATATSRPGGSN